MKRRDEIVATLENVAPRINCEIEADGYSLTIYLPCPMGELGLLMSSKIFSEGWEMVDTGAGRIRLICDPDEVTIREQKKLIKNLQDCLRESESEIDNWIKETTRLARECRADYACMCDRVLSTMYCRKCRGFKE